MTSTQRLRIGIVGAARVVRKSWPAMHRAGHVVTVLGCRDAARGEALVTQVLAELNNNDDNSSNSSGSSNARVTAPRVTDYDAVVSSPDVDVVYITLPVALRDGWVRACIRHGKHVVGEKPAAQSAAQLMSWLQAMAPQRLLYMDGTMLSHSRRVHAVREALRTLGPLRHMEASFAFCADDAFLRDDIRVHTALEPHGALGDVGWYCIRWLLHMVDFVLPDSLRGRITATAGAAIAGFEGHLRFPAAAAPTTTQSCSSDNSSDNNNTDDNNNDDRVVTATFDCSFTRAWQQTVRLHTRDAVVVVDSAINPSRQARPYFTIERTRWAADDDGSGDHARHASDGVTCGVVRQAEVVYCAGEDTSDYQAQQLWRDVADALVCVTPGEQRRCVDSDAAVRWSSYAYTTQLVMDRVLAAAMATTMTKEADAHDGSDGGTKATAASSKDK